MSDVVNSPNMSLPVPVVGVEPGPDYASDINACMSLLDSHDHTPGKGLPITPAAISITQDLTFNNFSATNLASAVYTSQTSISTIQSTYVKGVDLYYRDGNGNEIQLTISGNPAGGGGSITGLPDGTAGVDYSTGVYTFSSATNTPADLQIGSLSLGNIVANSKYLTLNPPNAMAANYSLNLPSLPAGNSYLLLDSLGNITTGALVDNSTIEFNSNVLRVKPGSIGTTQLDLSVFEWNIQTLTTSGANSFVVPVDVNAIYVELFGGGGGGGGGGSASGTTNGGGGGGGAGALGITGMITVTPGETLTINVGAGGTAGTAGSDGLQTGGGNGGTGGTSSVVRSAAVLLQDIGGAGGNGGAAGNVGGAGGPGGGGTGVGVSGSMAFSQIYPIAQAGGGGNAPTGTGGAGSANLFGFTGGVGGVSTHAGNGGGGGAGRAGNGGLGGHWTDNIGTGINGTAAGANTSAGGGGAAGNDHAGGHINGGIGGAGGSGYVKIYWLGHS